MAQPSGGRFMWVFIICKGKTDEKRRERRSAVASRQCAVDGRANYRAAGVGPRYGEIYVAAADE